MGSVEFDLLGQDLHVRDLGLGNDGALVDGGHLGAILVRKQPGDQVLALEGSRAGLVLGQLNEALARFGHSDLELRHHGELSRETS